MTETIFYLFGMGEDSKTNALFKSIFSGPFSIWVPYKLLSYIPSVSSLFGFYNTLFGFLFIPFGLLWGSARPNDSDFENWQKELKSCMDGSSAYFYYESAKDVTEKGTVSWFS